MIWLLLTGDNYNGIESLKRDYAQWYSMKDLWLLRYVLGIEVAQSPNVVFCPGWNTYMIYLNVLDSLTTRMLKHPLKPMFGILWLLVFFYQILSLYQHNSCSSCGYLVCYCSHYCLLGGCFSNLEISLGNLVSKSLVLFHIFFRVVCLEPYNDVD